MVRFPFKKFVKKLIDVVRSDLSLIHVWAYLIDRFCFTISIFNVRKLNKIKTNGALFIGILCKDRPIYLEKCLNSLKNSISENSQVGLPVNIFLFDDASSDAWTKKIISEFEFNSSNCNVFKYWRENSENTWASSYNWAISQMLKIGKSGDLIGTCDSDVIFSSDWIDKFVIWARGVRTNKDSKVTYFSAFNSSDYIFHKAVGKKNINGIKYIEKVRMGGCHYFSFYDDLISDKGFPRSLFFKGKAISGFDDESRKTRQMALRGKLNASLATSLVEHLGSDSILNEFREEKVSKPIYGLNLNLRADLRQLNLIRENSLGLIQADSLRSSVPKNDFSLMVPVGPKDLAIADKSISTAINCLEINDKDVYILSSSEIFESIARKMPGNAIHLNEEGFKVNGIAPWINQQLMKWSSVEAIDSKTLILDADTFILNSEILGNNTENLLLVNDEVVGKYRNLISHLLGIRKFSPYSFVTHHQIVHPRIINQIKRDISERHAAGFVEVIKRALEANPNFSLSEYELYGQYIVNNGYEYRLEFSFNRSLGRNFINEIKVLNQLWNRDFDSLSFHWYLPKDYELDPGYAKSINRN